VSVRRGGARKNIDYPAQGGWKTNEKETSLKLTQKKPIKSVAWVCRDCCGRFGGAGGLCGGGGTGAGGSSEGGGGCVSARERGA